MMRMSFLKISGAFVLCVCVGRAADLATLSESQRKQVNDWMSDRTTAMLETHKLEQDMRNAWANKTYTSPEIETLRKRYQDLQDELLQTQVALQKKVMELPEMQEKTRRVDDLKKKTSDLSKKIKETVGE